MRPKGLLALGLVAVGLLASGCGNSKPTGGAAATTSEASTSSEITPAEATTTTGHASITRTTAPVTSASEIPSACELLTPQVAAQVLGVATGTLAQENGGGGGNSPSVCGYLTRGSRQEEPQISLATRRDNGSEFRFLKKESEKKAQSSSGASVQSIPGLGQQAYEASSSSATHLVVLDRGILFVMIATTAGGSHPNLGPAALEAARKLAWPACGWC